jgi:hypothetical protein
MKTGCDIKNIATLWDFGEEHFVEHFGGLLVATAR